MNQPRTRPDRDTPADHRLSVDRTGRAHLALLFADSRHSGGRHVGRCLHRGALGHRGPYADRLACLVGDAAAARLQR